MKKTTLILAFVSASVVLAADWPCFLGPRQDSTSAETALLKEWPQDGPRVVWQKKIPKGFGAPAIVGGKIYTLDCTGSNVEGRLQGEAVISCSNLSDGKENWSFKYDISGKKYGFPGNRSMPAVANGLVFTMGPRAKLHCLDAKTGKMLWNHSLNEKFGAHSPNWASGLSPVAWKDLVICSPQGRNGEIVAFEAKTGTIRWQTPGRSRQSYSSPVIRTVCGVEQLVAHTGSGQKTFTAGYDLATGKTLWEYTGWGCRIPITAPTLVDEDKLFLTGEYGAGSAMIQLALNGGEFTVKELYKTQVLGSQIHQPFVVDGHIYANSNGNRRRDGFVCIDLKGNLKWKTERDPNFERGSMLLAEGLIYAINGNNGELVLWKPSPDGFQKISQTNVLSGKQAWAPLALSNGFLVVRDQGKMVCLDIRAK